MSEPPESVEQYIAAQPEGHRGDLAEVRRRILDAVPQAVESIAYGMPAYRLPTGRPLYFAGWAKHLSLHDVPRFDGELEEQVGPLRSGKDTVKFPYRAGIPFDLIDRIAVESARR